MIGAEGLAFDAATLEVPADRPFRLRLDNREGAPHNVAILDDAGTVLFSGEVFGGPAGRVEDVPAIRPGTYRFRCDVHPDMAGTVIAG